MKNPISRIYGEKSFSYWLGSSALILGILSGALLTPAVSAIPQQVKSNLEVLEIKFEPIQQGKNLVRVKIKNNAPLDQTFAIHIYTRSPDYGRGVGWGTQFFETLKPQETKWARFGFKIYGPITDRTPITLTFYNPESSKTFDPKRYFDRKNFMSQDLEHRTIPQKPMASAPKNLADEVIKVFRQVQTFLRENNCQEVWESFTKDCQTIDFFNQGADLFKNLIEGDSVYKPFFWQIDIFLSLEPESVTIEAHGLKLRAVSKGQVWTIDFVQEDGRWKIDWIGGYKPQIVLWADWQERLLPNMQKRGADHFDIYYFKGSTAEREIKKIIEEREKGYREICSFLDKKPDIQVRLVFFEDGKTKAWETGHQGAGWAFDQTIVEVYNEKEKLDPYHELCHILTRSYGDPPALFNEGFAVYMTERLGAPALKSLGGGSLTIAEIVKKLKRESQWIPLEELISYSEIGSDESKPEISYAEAASFVRFLIDTFGKEKFLQAYRSLKNSDDKSIQQDNLKKVAGVFGASLSDLKKQWEAAIFDGFSSASFGQAPTNKPAQAPEKDRGQILTEIGEARVEFKKEPDRAEARFRLARLLYQAGDFGSANTLLQPFLDGANPANDILFLGADLEYLFGRYENAENLLQRIIALNPGDLQIQARAQAKLVFAYYQSNQYAKSADLFKGLEGKIKLPVWDLMKAFGQERPYQVVWPQGINLAETPFVVTDPLPVISVELEGRPIHALIDTGADAFILDNEIAASMGIKPISSMIGTFAGGKQAEVGFAKAGSLKLGEVVLRAVPVSLLPTQRFSKGFAGGKYTIGGIVGTGVLKQFLSTLDYGGGKLILRRADGEGRQAMMRAASGKTVVEIPFVLAATHFMMARGRLDDKDGLTFFVDSGLASEAAFTAPLQTLKYAGIPVPETKVQEGIGGGGGGGFATGQFPIKKLGLGPLIQENLKGDYGSNPPESYWRLGFINDGIISHQFLRKYAWTIDFAKMKMIFVASGR